MDPPRQGSATRGPRGLIIARAMMVRPKAARRAGDTSSTSLLGGDESTSALASTLGEVYTHYEIVMADLRAILGIRHAR